MNHTWKLQLHRYRRWLTKRRATALSLAAICLSLCVYGTAAYFTAADTVHNTITTGSIGIRIVEKQLSGNTEVDFPQGGIKGVMPGSSVSKIVRIANTGTEQDVYVRVKVDRSIASANGGSLSPTVMTCNIDTANWTDGGDGYYYYNTPLAAGKQTAELFKTVTFAADMTNVYQGCTANIEIEAQAVQVKNNEAPVDAAGRLQVLQIQGWPAAVS